MLAHPIRCALESNLFETVYVSTEDREIAAVAETEGASVIARPTSIAEDRSTVVDVCRHALGIIEGEHKTVEQFCCIYATAAFIQPQDLRDALSLLLRQPAADVVMGVSQYSAHPVQAMKEVDGFLEVMWPEYLNRQSQFYPHLVASNGTIYWARTGAFLTHGSFYGPKLRAYEMPRSRAVDIDTPDDVAFARAMMASLSENLT